MGRTLKVVVHRHTVRQQNLQRRNAFPAPIMAPSASLLLNSRKTMWSSSEAPEEAARRVDSWQAVGRPADQLAGRAGFSTLLAATAEEVGGGCLEVNRNTRPAGDRASVGHVAVVPALAGNLLVKRRCTKRQLRRELGGVAADVDDPSNRRAVPTALL